MVNIYVQVKRVHIFHSQVKQLISVSLYHQVVLREEHLELHIVGVRLKSTEGYANLVLKWSIIATALLHKQFVGPHVNLAFWSPFVHNLQLKEDQLPLIRQNNIAGTVLKGLNELATVFNKLFENELLALYIFVDQEIVFRDIVLS